MFSFWFSYFLGGFFKGGGKGGVQGGQGKMGCKFWILNKREGGGSPWRYYLWELGS